MNMLKNAAAQQAPVSFALDRLSRYEATLWRRVSWILLRVMRWIGANPRSECAILEQRTEVFHQDKFIRSCNSVEELIGMSRNFVKEKPFLFTISVQGKHGTRSGTPFARRVGKLP